MDPNLFHIKWDQLLEVLAAVVVLSFIVERALALVFEHKSFVANESLKKFQEAIAFGLSFVICWYWDFDVVSVLLTSEKTSLLGKAITAAVIAGGSKASIKLFQDILGVKSSAVQAQKGGAGQPGGGGAGGGGGGGAGGAGGAGGGGAGAQGGGGGQVGAGGQAGAGQQAGN